MRKGHRTHALAGALTTTAIAVTVSLLAPAAASALPYVHAHRGGSLEMRQGDRVAARPENSLDALRAAARAGYVLELDVKLTADRVPVVIHDATLDRTTDCEGRVDSLTLAELRARCEIDTRGTAGTLFELAPGDPRRAPVPALAQALRLADRAGSEINLEIKNLPTEPDFDADVPPAFAKRVAREIKASGFAPSRLIVQSFWPANLDVIASDPYFDSAELSLLTLEGLNAGAPAFAKASGYDWVSPAWPVDAAYVSAAHAVGLRVVPYTLDRPAQVREAYRAGVDAVITNDPGLTRRVLSDLEPQRPAVPSPPGTAECREARAERSLRTIRSLEHGPGPRVFAMQPKQELRHVRTYRDFRTKIECMIRERVVPHLARDRPNVVAFNEDIGLMTLATGSRGAAARGLFADPGLAPSCEPQGVPCGVLAALGAITASYAPQIAAYEARFPDQPPLAAAFVAGTDTFARGWMQTFSDMAKRYDVHILGSNNQAPFRSSRDPAEIAAFADPDLARPSSVYVATEPRAYNEVFIWGPKDVRREGPLPLRNVVAQNKKVPLTPIEELIQLTPGPPTGPDAVENLRPYRVPGTKARLGVATSLPAFIYGHRLGEAPPRGDPCADVTRTYMRCLDALGTTVVIQDEANPGRWAGPSGEGNWQPLEWMRSTWRAIADPDVSFEYNVTPHVVGNLADLVFDGQSAITQRGLRGGRCNYAGNERFMPAAPESDPEYLRPYAGPRHGFVALAPWVSDEGSRDALRQTSARLAPGSGHGLENDYAETAIVADLTFPPDPRRAGCAGVGPEPGSVPQARPCSLRIAGGPADDRLRGTRRGDELRGGRGRDLLRGGGGRDCLYGGRGGDRLAGGTGRDLLRGGRGRDELRGGRGDDRLAGGAHPDVIRGGPGSDRIRARGGGPDRIDCGPGRDRARVDGSDRVRGCERVVRG